MFAHITHKNIILKFIALSILIAQSTFAEINVSICKWKNDATAAYTFILDDFGDTRYTPEIMTAGEWAQERGLKISTAAVVKRLVDLGEPQWAEMNKFISMGHEVINHSWDHKSPVGSEWNNDLDLIYSKDSLEAHLADTVWQKKITFYAFPEDQATTQYLDILKNNGYIGARYRVGYEGSRINSGNVDYNPFYTDYYGFISKEYLDSVLIPNDDPNDNIEVTDWWLTYPDKPYFNYKSPIEIIEHRHLDKAIDEGGWGVMEMHAIAPSMLHEGWWSPMSYDRYKGLLDRCKNLQDSNIIWMDVPSTIASYTDLRNKSSLDINDSIISIDYRSADERYLTDLTLKISVPNYNMSKIELSLINENNVETDIPFKLAEDSSFILVNINPSDGNLKYHLTGTANKFKKKSFNDNIKTKIMNGKIYCMVPAGAYSAQIFNLQGQAVTKKIEGYASRKEFIKISDLFSDGSYILKIGISDKNVVQKLIHF